MKSRNFLITRSTETEASATKGFLLASTDAPQDVAASAVRRFELQHNQSPRFARRRQERRQGQALLLAVLIMLLAALLSAGFLAVVSGNLNQSARVADKTRAIEASRAGIAYANAQLSGSSQGDLWRPIDVSPVPAPGSINPDYNSYYSQLDRVQGWANNLTPPADATLATYQRDLFKYRNVTYGKFPDPNQVAGDAPKFLVRVEQLPLNPNDDYYSPTLNPGHPYDAEHAGQLKITSIGLSEDDPNVFHRAVAYKSGRAQSPWASALRSVSNWKFDSKSAAKGVPFARVNETVNSTQSASAAAPAVNVVVPIDTKDAPLFSADDVPFNVVIINKGANSSVRGAVVTAVTAPTGNQPNPTLATITLARVEAPINADEVIQKAAAIGTGLNIDLLNTGTPAAITTEFPDYQQPNGILANGSLWLQNQVQISNLGKFGTKLITSGSLAIDNSTPAVNKNVLQSGDVTTAGQLLPSNVPPAQFPGTFVVASGVQKTDLVNDGWNKIGSFKTLGLDYIPEQTRTIEPFVPAKIDSSTNLARYRDLTRNAPVNSAGEKQGIYIDNRDDVEKVGAAAMSQKQLVEMLNSDVSYPVAPVPDSDGRFYTRNSPAATAAAGVSLEQRHLRGWVGADEFLARGALVELRSSTSADPGPNAPNPFIRVSLDARSDTNPAGPDQNKTFRGADGNLLPGVYSRDIKWPANGTLFAEGNIRIRGSVNLPAPPNNGLDPFPSLTVVSLNNIYIEGAVSVDNRLVGTNPAPDRKKLMLLAKKNVIVNPTRAVLARTDVQTVATNTAPITVTGVTGNTPNLTLPVANALSFNTGDYVTVQGQTKVIRGLIKGVPSDTELSIITPDTDTVPIGNPIVRSPLEKRDIGTPSSPSKEATFSLVDTENAINRRVLARLFVDASGNRNKVIFDHVGDLKQTGTATQGLTVKAEDFATSPPAALAVPRPAGFTATLTNKQPLNAMQDLDPAVRVVNTANRVLRTTNNFSVAPQQHNFTQTSAKTFAQFITEIELVEATDGDPTTPKGYRYTAKPTDPLLLALPSSALAGVGLRYAPGSYFDPAAVSPAKNRPVDFNADTGQPAKFTIPLATSIEYDLNGNSELINPPGITSLPDVRYIGFSPNGVSNDDALTVDSSFYQPKISVVNSTIDPRVLALQVSTLATGFTAEKQSIVLRRPDSLSDRARSDLLPGYEVRSMKLENMNISSTNPDRNAIKSVAEDMQINAFVYAQEGSWLIIPSDYFRSNPEIRGEKNAAGELIGSYIDYNSNKTPDAPAPGQPTEYVVDGTGAKVADLNRNGIADLGEKEAALRFVRYNTTPIKFYGAIVENQTAVVADVKDAAGTTTLVKGAVQDWMDKWTTYKDNGTTGGGVGTRSKFSLLTYAYDPSLALSTPAANQLRVPVTDDLLYQQ